MLTYLADLELETMEIVGGGHSRSRSYSSSPKETIHLTQSSVAFSFEASSTNLYVTRSGKGAGQGKPVIISLG